MLRILCLAVSVLVASTAAPRRDPPQQVRVADGVYVFSTAPYGDVGLDGNSVAIVSTDGVLVFDTNGTPAASAAVLDQIRKLTSQPVRYVVNSHWHWDHWYGTETYLDAFPSLQVMAHEATRDMMKGPALAFNAPGLDRDLPNYLAALEKKSAADPSLQPLVEQDRFFLDQKKNVRHVFPDTTFRDRATIWLGGREIQVLHYDRAVTPGDAFLYLPSEKIVVTGDLLVNPVSFALSCYPSGWLNTLEKIDALDAVAIVPGHGAVLHDKTLLRATMAVFRTLLAEGRSAKARGLAVDDARAAIMPRLRSLMTAITRDEPKVNQAFETQLVDWYLHRVYDELDGPLTNAIAPIPRS